MVHSLKSFIQAIKNPECSVDTYLKVGRIYRDFFPYEKQLDSLLSIIKKEELSPNFDLTILKVIQSLPPPPTLP